MALLNLSLITRTILSLLDARLPRYQEWPSGATLIASPAPPDLVTGDHALSFYLYHIREDPHTKSQDWQVDDAVPLRYRPMGITLNYVLCPRSSATGIDDRTYNDQLLMGLALKTLHDYPVIDDSTTVETAGSPRLVMPPALRGRGNRLRILLRPTPVEEASTYWQAGTQAARLAAYYEVNAALIEPDEPRVRRNRVLSVGVHTFLRGLPVIDRTSNRVSFTLPEESAPRELEFSPAEVPYGGSFEIAGSELRGDFTRLLINHRDFADPVEADASWNLTSNGSLLTATARPQAGSQAILPGIYGVIVRTTVRRTLPDASRRDFDSDSNEFPLAIVPRILDVQFSTGIGIIRVDGFDPSAIGGAELMLYIGSDRMERGTASPDPGQFIASPPDRISFRLPPGVLPGSWVPLRLIVRSSESAPLWVLAP